jgi:hypothetical protein
MEDCNPVSTPSDPQLNVRDLATYIRNVAGPMTLGNVPKLYSTFQQKTCLRKFVLEHVALEIEKFSPLRIFTPDNYP